MANTNKERYEFIESMFSGLEAISPERVIGKYVPLEKRGRHFMGLCPFHRDTTLGSFMVTPDKGIWKCFTCGDQYAGNAVKFVSLYKNISYLDAAFEVAMENGVITGYDYERYSKKKYDEKYVRTIEKRYSDKANQEAKPERAPKEVIHNVYLLIKKMCPISEEHKETLLNVRHLPLERIERDYFTCPINWRQIDNIVVAIREKYPQITDDILKTVPGFFYDKKRNKICFSGYKGLCLLIRDSDGIIRGIQVRRDNVQKGESRYVWIASTFAFYRPEEYSGGCGCGSPKDVLYARGEKKKSTLCITEGKFKAEVLAENGNTTISMQGVTTWKGIGETIKGIRKRQRVSGIYIFLDSDILGKHMLFKQSRDMCDYLSREFPDVTVKYAFWKKEIGKGIDDYVFNSGGTKGIQYYDWQKAAKIADSVFNQILQKFGVTKLQELKQEDVVAFESDMQKMLELHFCR